MALDAEAAWPQKREVSFLLNQADVASPRGLFLALGHMGFESFLTIAQIAVTLTGFVGITVTVRREQDGFGRLMLRSILQTTLGAAAFALVPDFLSRLLAPELMWRIACGGFGLYHLSIFSAHVFRQHSLKQMSAAQRFVTAATVPVIGLKLSVGLGFLGAYAFSIYYLGLLWMLGVGCYAFAVVLFHDGESNI